MLRVLILFLLGILIFRLASFFFRSISGSSSRRNSDNRDGSVGEGEIIKDEIDEEQDPRNSN